MKTGTGGGSGDEDETSTGEPPPKRTRLDDLTRSLTAFSTFAALLDAPGDYRPSMTHHEQQLLADVYDACQAARQDPRRAYRGGL